MKRTYPVEDWPQGYVTFLFTDLVNSTTIARELGDARYEQGLYYPHEQCFLEEVETRKGCVFNDTGDGFVAVFQEPDDAVAAAVAFQERLAGLPTTDEGYRATARVGIHRAEAPVKGTIHNDGTASRYGTLHISLASRVMGIGEAGQVLLSAEARKHLKTCLLSFTDWEGRFIKSLDTPWIIHEALYPGWVSQEPGTRYFPRWYVGEKNRYVHRTALETTLLENFKAKREDTAFLLAIQGEGGMGKTRLAVQLGVQLSGFFKDHVHFVSLALVGRGPDVSQALSEDVQPNLTAPEEKALLDELARAVGEALGLDEKQRSPGVVAEYLRTRATLLVLDNFESVACGRVQAWLATLVGTAVNLYILLTTRVSYGIVGLGTPYLLDEGMLPEEARALFIERVQQAHGRLLSGAQWEPHTPSIDLILEKTERVPLLIEYAAAWAHELGQQAAAQGLASEQERYRGTPEGQTFHDDGIAARRHHAFRYTSNWSYNLLGQHWGALAQKLFALSGRFVGTFTAETLQALSGEPEAPLALSHIASASLLKRTEKAGRYQYSMHRRTRLYALSLLDQCEEAAELRARYVDYFLTLAEMEGKKAGPGEIEVSGAAKILLSESASEIESALVEASEVAPAKAGRAVSALHNYISNSSRRISFEVIQVVIDRLEVAEEDFLAANCIKSLGDIAFYTGDNEEAARRYNDALPRYQKAQEPLGEANCIKKLGDIALRTGDNEEAARRYNDALPRFQKAQEPLGEANCIQRLGDIALYTGDIEAAARRYNDALPRYQRAQEPLGEANCIQSLGDIALRTGDNEEAARRYNDALPRFQRAQDPLGEANCIRSLGQIDIKEGRPEEGKAKILQALHIYTQIQDLYSQGVAWYYLIPLADSEAEREQYRNAARQAWIACGATQYLHLLEM